MEGRYGFKQSQDEVKTILSDQSIIENPWHELSWLMVNQICNWSNFTADFAIIVHHRWSMKRRRLSWTHGLYDYTAFKHLQMCLAPHEYTVSRNSEWLDTFRVVVVDFRVLEQSRASLWRRSSISGGGGGGGGENPRYVWKHRSSTPSGPLPCSPLNFNHNLLRQGTGTADHLLRLFLFGLLGKQPITHI